ncbi:MAG: phage tail protein [Candidatus Bathyarchaeota archaeon]|nr:phage tail protein [Candidatus Bathyarchaeota archaeon]
MFRVTNILNPLTGGSTTTEYAWGKGKPLSEFIKYSGECITVHNRQVIPLPLTEILPARRDEYTVMPIPTGGDRQTWMVLGYTAMGMMGTVGYATGNPALMFASLIGSNILNAYLQEKEKDQSTSPSYSWRHRSNPTAAYGSAMPVIYGKTRVRPILKNRYVVIDGDKQYLYALYSLAAHKVDERALPEYTFGNLHYEVKFSAQPGMTYINTRVGQLNFYPLFDDNGDLGKGWKLGNGTASFANDIIINGQAIGNFNRDVDWETRPGLPEQTMIYGFDITYSNYPQTEVLYLDSPQANKGAANFDFTPATRSISWDAHTLLLHGTVYPIKGGGQAYCETNTTYYIYFRLATDSSHYTLTTTEPVLDDSYIIAYFSTWAGDDFGKVRYPDNLPTGADWFSPLLKISDVHNIEFMFELPYGLYGMNKTGGMEEADCEFFAQYREFSTDDTGAWKEFYTLYEKDNLKRTTHAGSEIIGARTSRRTDKPIRVTMRATSEGNPLDAGKDYEIRVTANSSSIVKLINLAGIVYAERDSAGNREGFTYPGEPLLGIIALASGQVSSDLDIQVDIERSKVWVYNGSVWAQKDANNHAWAVYDILVQGYYNSDTNLCHPTYPYAGNSNAEAVYGCSVNPTHVDYSSFNEWAEYIDGIGYELNIVWDTFMTAWDAILRICQEGRGIVYPVGTTIYAMAHKASDSTQLFSMGNIHMDTFIQKFMETRKQANMLEVKYWDADRNYDETILAVRTTNWDEDTSLNKPTSITLYGTTGYSQASKIARFILLVNELLNNVISFGVDVDALAAQVGDVVEINHDVLNIGQSGRITAVSHNPATDEGTITFDRILSLSAGITYELEVRHSNGDIERKTVVGSVDSNQITWGPGSWDWTRIPEVYEVYSFGVQGEHTSPYRIVEISRTSELMRTLTLMQYDGALYTYLEDDSPDGEFGVPKIVPPDAVGDPTAILNTASNVELSEVLSKNRNTGEYESSIVVRFDSLPPPAARGAWEIYLRDVDVSDINWKGTWLDDTPYNINEKVELDGVTFVSTEEDNESRPINIDA